MSQRSTSQHNRKKPELLASVWREREEGGNSKKPPPSRANNYHRLFPPLWCLSSSCKHSRTNPTSHIPCTCSTSSIELELEAIGR